MELNKYQEKAMETCMDTSDNISYMLLNLMGEVGEVSSKMAKHLRNGEAVIERNNWVWTSGVPTVKKWEYEELIQSEVGDCLWQVAGLCHAMGWRLEDIALMNLDKLASRKARGVISGDGDKR